MGGGLMQLVAYGAQDIYLTGNPQITFFKVVYRRHTNFSMECIKQSFKGTVAASSRVVATLARNGDLVHDCFLKFYTGNALNTNNNNLGHQIINNIEVEIGGQLIDKHFGHWMEAHSELTEVGTIYEANDPTPAAGYGASASGNKNSLFQITSGAGGFAGGNATLGPLYTHLYVPLRFWFCRHVGSSLPLIALQYHEVNINITLTAIYSGYTGASLELWCNYIYLDTDERRRFAQVSHEYLIEQVQVQSFVINTTGTHTFKLNLNHPVKELIWGSLSTLHAWGKSDNSGAGQFATSGNAPSSGTQDSEPTFQLKLNGHDRFEKLPATYFSRYQAYKYHTSGGKGSNRDTLHIYSFALKPEEHQPSGTCNFSRIDNAQFIGTKLLRNNTMYIYAVNYNVLRIMSGMGGLAYSN